MLFIYIFSYYIDIFVSSLVVLNNLHDEKIQEKVRK